jgi:hypothetical protein
MQGLRDGAQAVIDFAGLVWREPHKAKVAASAFVQGIPEVRAKATPRALGMSWARSCMLICGVVAAVHTRPTNGGAFRESD